MTLKINGRNLEKIYAEDVSVCDIMNFTVIFYDKN